MLQDHNHISAFDQWRVWLWYAAFSRWQANVDGCLRSSSFSGGSGSIN